MVKGNYPNSLKSWWEKNPEKRSEFAKKQMADPLRRLKQSHIGKSVFSNPETQLKCLENRKSHPLMAPGPQHHTAKIWRLRDNRGRIYEFRNLRDFIRNNPDLFDPEDVIWKKQPKRGVSCRAMALANLHPDRKRPFGTWKGWTWFSMQERRFNEGQDLLDRKETFNA